MNFLLRFIQTCMASVVLAWPAAASAIDIDKCDATAKSEILKVWGAMNSRLSATVARFTWLDQKQRDELKRKWPKLKIDCEDDRNKCSKDTVTGDGFIITGFAHGGLGNTVNVCYYNLVEANLRLCDLAGNLWHEKGHADGMPKDSHHNDPQSFPEVLKDAVYRMGLAARDECVASVYKTTANRPLLGSATLGIGASCTKDAQCNSAKCKSNQCVCKTDADCGDRKCKEPFLGTPRCE